MAPPTAPPMTEPEDADEEEDEDEVDERFEAGAPEMEAEAGEARIDEEAVSEGGAGEEPVH